MKSIVKMISAAALLLSVQSVSAQEVIGSFAQLPKAAQSFIKANFSAADIDYVVEEKEYIFLTEYTVKFKNGTTVDFDSKGNWEEIDAQRMSVPMNLVPATIQAYVKRSFPQTTLTQISRTSRKYEVELSNGLDLEFNKNGKFIRIDD